MNLPDTDRETDAQASRTPVEQVEQVEQGNQGNQGNAELSPLDGGRWRPVSPDELLRKNASPNSNENAASGHNSNQSAAGIKPPVVQLERRQELEHKLKSNPTDLDGFLELAQIYRDELRPLESKRLLKQAGKIFPDNEAVRFQFEEAVLARSLQQLREVADLAKRVKNPEADRELQRSQSDWAQRRMDVCRARLERDPSQVGLRLTMAEAKFDAEMFEDAMEDASQLLELDDLSAQAHFLRARCLSALGKDLPAMKELRAVALRRRGRLSPEVPRG